MVGARDRLHAFRRRGCENDIEMFAWAGTGGRAVAMGQAPDEVKAAATEVTGSIHDAGLGAVLATLP